MGDSLGNLTPDSDVEVLEGVACLVIVGVEDGSCGSTPDGDLLGGLDLIGTGGKTTSGDSDVEEWAVIGTTVECGWLGDELSILGEVILPELLDLGGTRGTGCTER